MPINLKRYYLFPDAFYKYILLYTSYYIIAHSTVCVRTRLCYETTSAAVTTSPA